MWMKLVVCLVACVATVALVRSRIDTTPAPVSLPAPGQRAAGVCTLKVSGMTCAGCAVAVKVAADVIGGGSQAIVSCEKGEAQVTFDPAKTTPASIAATITRTSGFKPTTTSLPHGADERAPRAVSGGGS